MARKDFRSYTFHCTEKTPFKGGLREGVSVLHDTAHQSFSNSKRTCRWCHADLGTNFERSWEREARMEAARTKSAEQAKQEAELIRRLSISIDDRNGKKPQAFKVEPLVQVVAQDGVAG